MSWHRSVAPIVLIFAWGPVAAEGYIVGIGAQVNEDTRTFSAFGEVAAGDRTWLSAGAATSRTDGAGLGLDAIYADAQIDHWFAPVGVRVAAAYWGDPDVLDSVDLRASIYVKNQRFSLSADFERRNYDFLFDSRLLENSRAAEFSANGIGLAGRLEAGDRATVYLGGMWYDYSRDVGLQPGISDLRFLSRSRLLLANSLVDRKTHAGIEVDFGTRSLDFRYANWRSAAGEGRIDSFGVGLLMPLVGPTDIELRLSHDDSDAFGKSTVLSVFLYIFGD